MTVNQIHFAGNLNPPQEGQPKKPWWNSIAEGLAIAKNAFGIASDISSINHQSELNDTTKVQRQGMINQQSGVGDTQDLAQRMQGGVQIVPSGTENSLEYKYSVGQPDESGTVPTKTVAIKKPEVTKEPAIPPHANVPGVGLTQMNPATGQWETKVPEVSKPTKDLAVSERNTLQGRYDSDLETKKSKEIADSYETAQAFKRGDSPQGDIGLVYAWMKAVDPGSVVRPTEQEQAQAQGGLMERAKAQVSSWGGDGNLTDKQRADIINQIEARSHDRFARQDKLDQQYKDLAARRGVPANDMNYVVRPNWAQTKDEQAKNANAPAAPAAGLRTPPKGAAPQQAAPRAGPGAGSIINYKGSPGIPAGRYIVSPDGSLSPAGGT